MKLTEAFELYVAESGNLNTDQSRQSFQKTIRQLANYAGDRALGSYTADELTAFCLGDGGRATAPRTINARRTRLHSVFAWCTYRKLISRDPTNDLAYTVKTRGGAVRKHTWLTKTEAATIDHAFNLEDPMQHRDYALYRTTLMLGLRRSETASLRWDMFRDDLSTVSIVGKGRKLATLPLPPKLRSVLAGWRSLQPVDAVPWPRFNWDHDFAGNWRLRAEWTNPIGPSGVYDIIRRHTPVAPHDLRRSFAGILDADGVPLKVLQQMMRHENSSTTDHYLESSPSRLAMVAEGVDW